MSKIVIDETKCIGCNSCVRICPTHRANTAALDMNGNPIIKIDDDMCIKCGECIKTCESHGARSFVDDTEEFFDAIKRGEDIALIVAPAIVTAFKDNWKQLLVWLRQQGVKTIYDVSFGADICTWAHIKLIEQKKQNTLFHSHVPQLLITY